MATPYTILCVEGRKPVANRWACVLDDEGHRVVCAGTRRTALAQVERAKPSMIIVDTPSLRCDATRLCDSLRETSFGIRLLALLDSGVDASCPDSADGHMRYPITGDALLSRVADMLSPILQVGDVIFDTERLLVGYCPTRRRLTPKLAQLLQAFMLHPGQVLTRAFLMKRVWETEYLGDTGTLNVHIRYLRKAIEEDPSSPVYIRTVRGIGYRFSPPSDYV